MELCTKQPVSNLPICCHGFSTRIPNIPSSLPLPHKHASSSHRGCRALSSRITRFSTSLPRATSEDSSTGPNQYARDERDGVIALEDPPIGQNIYRESEPVVAPKEMSLKEDSPIENQEGMSGFLEKFNLKENDESQGVVLEGYANLVLMLDSDDAYPIILYGTGALVAVWLASAVVAAIDSIPLIPKLMEVVGLGYTIWFSTRYLLFKGNREELAGKLEDLKREVLGSDNE